MAPYAALFNSRPSARARVTLSIWQWTCVGALAVPLWATWPALSLPMRPIPPFESLTVCFFAAWIALLLLPGGPRAAREESLFVAWVPAAMFGLAECGSGGFFLLATRHISAAEANLIVYLWPAMLVGAGAALGFFRLRWRQILGITLGFLGVAVLMWGAPLALSWIGMAWAFAAGASWTTYCVFRLKWPTASERLLPRGCAIATIVCGVVHLIAEPKAWPTLTSATAAALSGILPTAMASLAWDNGIRRGDGRLLAVMAYGTPLCSALLLTAPGIQALSVKLAIAAIVIVAAGWLSRVKSTD